MALRTIHDRLREDPALHDPAYDPVHCDFNPVIDNHGAAVNMTVPRATVRVKFRYSAGIDPEHIVAAVREAAKAAKLKLVEKADGKPPELPADHRLVRMASELTGNPPCTAPYGTDGSVLQALAPCLVMGPGDIAVAHTPHESVRLSALAAAVPVFQRMAERMARG